jgi:hypothetical protein
MVGCCKVTVAEGGEVREEGNYEGRRGRRRK